MLTEECTAILQNKLPPKLKDPGSFTIPCTIGNSYFGKALCDLGASINLMPFSISDFIVLDKEEDREIPLLLGRPFLATGRTLIDVQQGKLILRVQDEQVTFEVFEAMKYPSTTDTCFNIDVIDELVVENFEESHLAEPLEACLVQSGTTDSDNSKISNCAHYLEASPPYLPKGKLEYLTLGESTTPQKPSIIETPSLELKPLPSHLKYAYLHDSSLPVIISSSLTGLEEEKLGYDRAWRKEFFSPLEKN
ncbi:uncharacterized protein LOC131306817 [Rhododendron vialii]|uniref:uncharacterized protein LOC131306817 n=1 Tax=Rhododendron vialii TaxID=182163 RepID=UPI00265F84CE|nr:uncharacterized protein LOC131306817 [Rhododendron vialii]